MSERVLLLTYSFPPTAVPEAALAAKRMANLPLEVYALSVGPFRGWMGGDPSLDSYVTDGFESVERIQPSFLVRHLPLGRLGFVTKMPDQFRLLNRTMRERVKDRLSEFDYLMTWSQWHSIHLVGHSLAALAGAPPWVAHLSDPWSNNPYLAHGRLLRSINERLEAKVLRAADLLLFPSQETADHVLRSTNDMFNKVAIIPHAFDPKLYPAAATDRAEGIVLRHLGHFYGPRTPEPLFKALLQLNRVAPDVGKELKVELIGKVAPHMLQGTFGSLPAGQVSVRPPVSYVGSLRLMKEADVLLVVDAPAEKSVFLPSKLIDYLGADRPIVGVTPPGPSAELIRDYGGWVADPRDALGITAALQAASDRARASKKHEPFGNPMVRARYEVGRIAKEMVDALHSIERRQG